MRSCEECGVGMVIVVGYVVDGVVSGCRNNGVCL